jgi:hypothetical protein
MEHFTFVGSESDNDDADFTAEVSGSSKGSKKDTQRKKVTVGSSHRTIRVFARMTKLNKSYWVLVFHSKNQNFETFGNKVATNFGNKRSSRTNVFKSSLSVPKFI